MNKICEKKEDLQIRILGRGGQGIFTVGKIIGKLFFQNEKFVSLIPRYGAERRGARIFVDLRISNLKIRDKSLLDNVSHLFIIDRGVFITSDLDSISNNGFILINDNKLRNKYKDISKTRKHFVLFDMNEFKDRSKIKYLNETLLLILPRIFKIIKEEQIESQFQKTYKNELNFSELKNLSKEFYKET